MGVFNCCIAPHTCTFAKAAMNPATAVPFELQANGFEAPKATILLPPSSAPALPEPNRFMEFLPQNSEPAHRLAWFVPGAHGRTWLEARTWSHTCVNFTSPWQLRLWHLHLCWRLCLWRTCWRLLAKCGREGFQNCWTDKIKWQV